MKRKVNFIIVGQGLAGSCLALQLLSRGMGVLVVEDSSSNRSSVIAAGLFNPIAGKVMKKTWHADRLFPFLMEFYKKAEDQLGSKFFFPLPMYRPFLSEEERDIWTRSDRQHEFVRSIFTASKFPDDVKDSLGGLELAYTGFIDTRKFIHAVREHLMISGCYLSGRFSMHEVMIEKSIIYRGVEYEKIVFCDGVSALDNPVFGWLPIRKLKGELLKIKTTLSTQRIYNRGVYVVPSEDEGYFTVGSTYLHDLKEGNTTSGVEALIDKTRRLLANQFEIVDKTWGWRPTVPDRRPILGEHPERKNLVIFNGLGTKGVSQAPYFSGQLADWLERKAELEPEVNISRYYSLYFKSLKTV